MAGWMFYFAAKGLLAFKGAMRFDPLLNAAFAVFLMLPMPAALGRVRAVRWGRRVLNILLALMLLWNDSWLPSFGAAIATLNRQGMPEMEYVLFFVYRYVDGGTIAAGGVLLACCLAAEYAVKRKWKRAADG